MPFIGDDWAENHHDVELMDGSGRTLRKARLPERVKGIAALHVLVGEQLGANGEDGAHLTVVIGIETDRGPWPVARGPWVTALVLAGYDVFGINPLQAARYRERHSVSGAKSDAGDAHILADMVRTDSHQLRAVEVDTQEALAICNIEDKRARQRLKERGLPKGSKRNAEPRLVEGQIVTNWKQALAQLAMAYPDRFEPYL